VTDPPIPQPRLAGNSLLREAKWLASPLGNSSALPSALIIILRQVGDGSADPTQLAPHPAGNSLLREAKWLATPLGNSSALPLALIIMLRQVGDGSADPTNSHLTLLDLTP
jgi:hypothetical protein